MEEDDNSGDLQLQVETPHTQRLSSSEFSIKLQVCCGCECTMRYFKGHFNDGIKW